MSQEGGLIAAGRSRRSFLAAAGGTSALLGTPFLSRAWAQSGLKVGIVLPKQGPQTEQAANTVNGCRIALEQAGGRVLGQACDLVWLDEPNPQVGQQNMERLIQQEKVFGVVGGLTSSAALAEAAVAKRLRVPFVANGAARELTGKDCNRYTFRANTTVPAACRALTPYLLDRGKRWYFVTASYAYGQDISASFREILGPSGGTEIGSDQTPLGTFDFSSYVLKIRQAKPDVVIAGIAGDDLTNFLKQYAEIGLAGQIPVSCPIVSDSDIEAVGANARGAIFGKIWDHADPANSPAEIAFAKDYRAKFGRPPTDKSFLGWISMKLLLAAAEEAKSTAPEKIVEALETRVRFGDGVDRMAYRDWDHQLVRRMLVVTPKSAPSDRSYFDILKHVPDNAGGLDALYGGKPEIACTLGAL